MPKKVHYMNLSCQSWVSSEGFLPVFIKVLEVIDKNYFFFTFTKGFVSCNGKVYRISRIAEELFSSKFHDKEFLWTSIGGPVKAVELSDNIPTVSTYGTKNKKMKDMASLFSTDCYRIISTEDLTGVELSAVFKNVYAMTMGICDGIYKSTKEGMYHNFSSLIFNQSVKEMSLIVDKEGGDKSTVFDFAGIGDLYTTAQSGRNRRFGELIGKGINPDKVCHKMLKEGELAEGYHTLKLGMQWLECLDKKILKDLPLFNITYNIIFHNFDPTEGLKSLLKIYRK